MTVKFTCFWEDEKVLFQSLQRYAFGQTKWKDMTLVTGNEYDMLVILTRPHADCKDYNPGKAVTFLTEPPQSANVRNHQTSAISPAYLHLPFWNQFTQKERRNLMGSAIEKNRLLSSVTSDLSFLEGHAARLQLLSLLDKTIKEGLDIWGKDNHHDFFETIESYRGELTDKYEGLWDYQYHLACENSFIEGYFTEKITDPIIAECLCFYDGCRNMEDFIDPRSFIRIDVFNPVSAIDKIIQSIEADEWSKRRRYIQKQRIRLLTILNPLNIIWLFLKGKDVLKECKL